MCKPLPEVTQSNNLCCAIWETTTSDGLRLLHQCMLAEGHKGECKCFDCNELPLDIHTCIGADEGVRTPSDRMLENGY